MAKTADSRSHGSFRHAFTGYMFILPSLVGCMVFIVIFFFDSARRFFTNGTQGIIRKNAVHPCSIFLIRMSYTICRGELCYAAFIGITGRLFSPSGWPIESSPHHLA
jgi:ABC-type sugar transport system permease subunit